jgi:hypothetical protein
MMRLLYLFACWLLTATSAAGAAGADELTNRMIVFDLSQSMWAPVGSDRRRYEVAQIVGARLVREMAAQQPEVSVGLMAFGHQYAPGEHLCNEDVARLADPSPLASRQAAERLARIAGHLPTPKGKTPLKEAIRQAALALKGGILIVISDFQETCDGGDEDIDPCTAFAELQRSGELDGIAIRYIVAVADATDDITRMSAFAQCTGAKLVRVDSAQAAADMAAAITLDLKRLSTRLDLRVAFKFDRDPDLPPLWGRPPLDGTISVEGALGSESARVDAPVELFSLIGGPYKVTTAVAGARSVTDVVLGKAGLVLNVMIPVARVALSAVGPEGETVTDGVWMVTAANGAKASRQGASTAFNLPPGRYHFAVRSPLGGAEFDLDLWPGSDERRELRLDARFQQAAAKATVSLAAQALSPSLFADRVAEPELLLTGAGRTLRITAGSGAKTVEPGHYDAAIAWGGTQWPVAPLDLGGGAAAAVSVQIAPSTVEATFAGAPGGDVLWTITAPTGEVVRLRGRRLSQSLPPGSYAIEAELDGETRRDRIEAGLGQALRIELTP